MKKIASNMSLKMSYMLYMLIFIIIAVVLSSFSVNLAEHIRNDIRLAYSDSRNEIPVESGKLIIETGHNEAYYTAKDKLLINVCDFIQMWSIPIFFGGCIILSSLLFYRSKLKKPIEILEFASSRIAVNDLGFSIYYDSRDEMGQLCESFEKMRHSLEANNHEMWRSMEEQKRLNTAFAHDLRTPLTVLKGYTDFLKNYIPGGKLTGEKIISTVNTMSEHITRLENHVIMMNEMQKLEDVCVDPQKTQTASLLEKLQSTTIILAKENNLLINITDQIKAEEIFIDTCIVIRVFENVISNAVRYAKCKINIECKYDEGLLSITIADDGKGFSEDGLINAAKPFYRDKAVTDGLHFGIGLNVCKVLCEKHGGILLLENEKGSGARVTVRFSTVYINSPG